MKYCMQTDDEHSYNLCTKYFLYFTIIKLKMVQTVKATSDKFNAYKIHTYTNGISINKIILLIQMMKMIQFH
jgi:hypothetical protein